MRIGFRGRCGAPGPAENNDGPKPFAGRPAPAVLGAMRTSSVNSAALWLPDKIAPVWIARLHGILTANHAVVRGMPLALVDYVARHALQAPRLNRLPVVNQAEGARGVITCH